jgi:Tfp pilus assembly protein PilV
MATMNTKGFTVISVLIAILILATGLTALTKTNASVVNANSVAANRTMALSVARGSMEDVRSRSPFVLASQPTVTVNGQGQLDINGKFSRTVTLTPVAHNLVRVVVTIDYPEAVVPVELVTLVYVPPAQLGAASST